MTIRLTPVELERFWSYIEKTDGCWFWRGGRKGHPTHRYGMYNAGGKTIPVHRLSFMLASGEDIPPKMLVCHKCDNPICVRPDHLFLGTHRDNGRDMAAKGRSAKGAYPHVLTEDKVREIRAALAAGENRAQIARRYGVTWPIIDKIRTRKIWKKVA